MHKYLVSFRLGSTTKCLITFSSTQISAMTNGKMAEVLGNMFGEIPKKFANIEYEVAA